MAAISLGGLVQSPWKNGRGRKADIAAGDGWFVGLAWIDQDAPFSDFTGYHRTCVLLDGAGFTLSFADRPPLRFGSPGTAHAFPGGSPAQAHLTGGPCRVFNVMTRDGQWDHRVRVVDRVPGEGYAVLLRGTVQASGDPAGPGDVLVLPHEGTPSPDVLVVAAEVIPARAAPG